MDELPTGTVTFVFTDIEGSTRLLHRLTRDYERAMQDHRRILREAFSSCGGVEVDTQGDAFFVAFPTAAGAVEAAARAQRALADHGWPRQEELRVRMGIHSGEPVLTQDGYVGADVHLGARICAAAHGAQVVVSDATAHLLSPDLEGLFLRPLGEHRLKDIAHPVALHQLTGEGLEADFPPLRTPSATHPTNLPARLEPLIGRDQDLAALGGLLTTEAVSLVTVTGPGGTGKTRLALATGAQLLDSFTDGVFFIDLSALTDPDLVVPSVAHALSLRETPARSLTETVTEHLSSRQMLLILDNLEQVSGAAADIASLLTSAPQLKVLATSRGPLRVAAEKELSLSPLPLPEPTDASTDIASSPAVELFVARAKDVAPGFSLTAQDAPTVAEICRRLDGLPLALELAAARVRILSLAALNERLSQSLKVLRSTRRDASERQRTLTGAIAWSNDLLSSDERALFRRLGVFAGGLTLEAAEQVCDRGDLDTEVLDALAALVDKSLVRTDEARERFYLLETIRAFAEERLEESGEAAEISLAHADFFRALAEAAEPHLVRADEKQWLDRLERDHDNIRAALDTFAARGEWEDEMRMAIALRLFWRFHGHLDQGRKRFEDALARSSADDVLRARALGQLGTIAYSQGDYSTARAYLEEALRIEQESGLTERVAGTLSNLALVAKGEGDYDAARSLCEEALRIGRDVGDSFLVTSATNNLADLALVEGRYDVAAILSSEGLLMSQRADDTEGIATAFMNGGFAALKTGRLRDAKERLSEAMAAGRRLGSIEIIASCIAGCAAIADLSGEAVAAARLLGAAAKLREEAGLAPEKLRQGSNRRPFPHSMSLSNRGRSSRRCAMGKYWAWKPRLRKLYASVTYYRDRLRQRCDFPGTIRARAGRGRRAVALQPSIARHPSL